MRTVLKGVNFIGYSRSAGGNSKFQAFAPSANKLLQEKFSFATEKEWHMALRLAQHANAIYSNLSSHQRAKFLEAISEEIMLLDNELIERCMEESSLSIHEVEMIRERTCEQIMMFARLLKEGWWVDARIDTASPERKPLPKPDIRRMLVPVGPVAVFGANSFPLTFATAGGDTVSALAAGCPVIFKAHSSQAGTNELISVSIIKAAKRTGMPEGVFSSVYLSPEDSIKMIKHSNIKALCFTGSRNVGMRLYQTAVSRFDPIPVFAEMKAINPVLLLPGSIKKDTEKIIEEIADCVSGNMKQISNQPGLILAIDDTITRNFLQQLSNKIIADSPAENINLNVYKAYAEGVVQRDRTLSLSKNGKASDAGNSCKFETQSALHAMRDVDFFLQQHLTSENFGSTSLIVLCQDQVALEKVLESLDGQLTITIHADKTDKHFMDKIVNIITKKAGRIVFGGCPSSVELCHSIQHGGPFPSTIDGRSSSAGTAAIYRFVRPVCYQDFPNEFLPVELQNQNPLNITRLVNGLFTNDRIADNLFS